MAKKTRYIIDPVERERNNQIRQEAAKRQSKIDSAVKQQKLEEQVTEQEPDEKEIDLTPADPVFSTKLRRKGWYDVINEHGNVVDEEGLIPVGEIKALRLRAAEQIAERLSKEA